MNIEQKSVMQMAKKLFFDSCACRAFTSSITESPYAGSRSKEAVAFGS